MKRSLAQRLLYWTAWHAVNAGFMLLWRLRRFHIERIPARGAALLVCNHQSHLDPPMVAMCLPRRQFRPLARASLFKVPVFGALIRALNAVPLKDNEGDLAAVRAALTLLEAGEPVCVFPEGTRTPDGEIKEFRRGAVLLLKRARCPVVPMAIDGAFEAWPKHRAFPRPFVRLRIIAGEPIAHDDLLRDGPDAALARLHAEVLSLHAELRNSSPRSLGDTKRSRREEASPGG